MRERGRDKREKDTPEEKERRERRTGIIEMIRRE